MTTTPTTEKEPQNEPSLVNEENDTEIVDPEVTEEDGVMEEEEGQTVLENICILPPLQKDSNNSKSKDLITKVSKDAILLPPISPAEPVSAIRGALAEIRGYAHITNYRLIVEDVDDELHQSIIENSKVKINEEKIDTAKKTTKTGKSKANGSTGSSNTGGTGGGSGGGKKKKKKSSNGSTSSVSVTDVVSPYTSEKAAIKVTSSVLSLDNDPIMQQDEEKRDDNGGEIVLNDYGDLSPYVETNELDSNMGLRMVLERYDAGLVKEHVIKTRFLLDGNAPCVLRVVSDEQSDGDKDGEEEGASDNVNANVANGEKNEKEGENSAVSYNFDHYTTTKNRRRVSIFSF
jgi:hypothetical protein